MYQFLIKMFADDIKVFEMPVEILGRQAICTLYVKYAYMNACVIAPICFLWCLCSCYGFWDFGLSIECMVVHPYSFPFFPNFENARRYQVR